MQPASPRPYRVAFFGWAQLSLQERQGTGYNLYASELAAGLAARGHATFYLRSGLDYALGEPLRTKPFETWRGVACHHLVNSPNLSPAAENFRNVAAQLRSPELVRVVLDWLDHVGAEIVHVHSLEGLSLDVLPAIRASGRALVVTPHNYWYVCPQVDLLHREQSLCSDYDGGRRCVDCIPAPDPRRARRRRAARQTLERLLGPDIVPATRAQLGTIRAALRNALRRRTPPGTTGASPSDLFQGFEPSPGGLFDHGLSVDPAELPELGAAAFDANERFLAAKHHARVEGVYGERRAAGVAALNAASAILAPSDFLRRAHASMGVGEDRLRTVTLGSPHFDRIHRRAVASPFYGERPWDPTAPRTLRFAFHGTTRNNKGLLWLLRAIPLLDAAIRQRCHFVIRASGPDWPLRRMMSAYPELQFGGGYDSLQLLAAAGDYDVGVMTHVWFENLPLVMLEHLSAGKFVLSSRLGGCADWIDPPRNGLLYAAGHPEELAACITRLVTGEVAIPSPREVQAAARLPSFREHVETIEAVYAEVAAGPA